MTDAEIVAIWNEICQCGAPLTEVIIAFARAVLARRQNESI